MILDLTTVEGTRRTTDTAYHQIHDEYVEYLLDEDGGTPTLDGMLDYVEHTIAAILEDGVEDADDAVALAIYYLTRTRIIELQEA